MTSSAASPNIHTPPNQYLPGYLLGDITPHGRTQTPLRWPSGHAQTTPISARRQQGTKISPASSMVTTPPSRSEILRSKDRSAAPPVQSLFESPMSSSMVETSFHQTPYSSFTQQHTSPAVSRPISEPEMMQIGGSSPLSNTSPLNVSNINQSFQQVSKIHTSPTQMDPFYTQGESLLVTDQLDETWVTIFGFNSAAASYILDQFSQYGNILQHVISSDGNWMHIQYQSKLQAKKALSKNGKIFGDSIMLGVTPCIDKNLMESNKENIHIHSILSAPSNVYHSTPMSSKIQSHSLLPNVTGTPNSLSTGVRPINTPKSLQKRPLNESEVFQTARTPQKSNDFFSKAMEYVFGW
ncbi:nucleoporin NUP35 [Octopus bimaculoides]|uniref:Nucleoporin NUP53 n=1 Tax=Octopus bimaculoides TaxID=37653 RepID=A0A0L8HN84_OCTBM|nr:nucleoporin NUP35 [Octopus bimaculoides]XP_014770928.1 nucleoporin NUP35 [Octopus bimaculoides]XP_052822146.1 nucleoporin NUP35 [Octopus bimaculoides]|eukprot:XP_014770927.1 PREDICTED: nucleoporin NUP53-like isoform X1 [Octopus bimaculoides]